MSLRLRLALWYGALTGLVVVLVMLLTYALHTRGHYDDLDHTLVTVAQHVAEEYDGSTGPASTSAITAPPSASLVLRVYAADGRLVAASPNAALAPEAGPRALLDGPSVPPFDPLVGLAPSFMPGHPEPGVLGLASAPDGTRWRLYALPLRDGRALLAAMPLDRLDAATDLFRRIVPLLAGVGAVATLLAGYLLAGRAIRPVATVTEAADAIARSRDFARRVPEPPRRDELGHLAATFNAMLASLHEAYQAQQRFVADASHELRAPITAIQANLELVRRHPEMSAAERDEAIAEAGREAGRLVRLVADLLALARADAGLPLRRWPVELDRVLLDAFAEARQLARGQRLEIGRLETIVISGDPDRLKQLVLILLDNAIKYTPDGGQVTLELQRNETLAEILVRDTGIGIAPEDLPRVFERFYRADPARGRDPGGTGLGLPIARWIAEQHGGQITLASRPGEGTIARIRLPLNR